MMYNKYNMISFPCYLSTYICSHSCYTTKGIDYVAIDTENDLAYVTGPIDPTTLVNNVAKLGKRVKLVPNNFEEKHNHNHATEGGCRDKCSGDHQRRKTHTYNNCCCGDGRHCHKKDREKEEGRHYHKKEKEKEEEHICEAYEPPKIDERICRDYYCKVHPKMRTIVDKVPADSSNSLFGGLPFHTGYGPYGRGGGSYIYPGWYGEEPPRFGYHPPPRMLPHPFGFQ